MFFVFLEKLFSTLFTVFLLCLCISAHSGKTDVNGGHYDRSTGEYHYHHGYSAHQHINGVCPHDFNDATDSDSKYTHNNRTSAVNNGSQASHNSIEDNDNKTRIKNDVVIIIGVLGSIIAFIVACFIRNK